MGIVLDWRFRPELEIIQDFQWERRNPMGQQKKHDFDLDFYWMNNPAGHPAGLFVTLAVFMRMYMHISSYL